MVCAQTMNKSDRKDVVNHNDDNRNVAASTSRVNQPTKKTIFQPSLNLIALPIYGKKNSTITAKCMATFFVSNVYKKKHTKSQSLSVTNNLPFKYGCLNSPSEYHCLILIGILKTEYT